MYFSHHRIIKYVGFEPIYCAINLDDTPSFRVFNEFDFVFLSNVLLVLINKIILSSKKKKRKKYLTYHVQLMWYNVQRFKKV